MTPRGQEPTVLVQLPVQLVDAILKMRASLDRDLVASLAADIESYGNVATKEAGTPSKLLNAPRRQKYKAEYLGECIGGRTLPDVFASIVDLTAEVAPEVLEALANMSARSRRYVARTPEAVHPGNRKLPVERTASGWWISKNVGQEDLRRALKALCRAGNLRFGTDVKFVIQS
jgi:hypothetical protein